MYGYHYKSYSFGQIRSRGGRGSFLLLFSYLPNASMGRLKKPNVSNILLTHDLVNHLKLETGYPRAPSPEPEPPSPKWSFIFGAPFRLTSKCKCDHCSKSLPYSALFSATCCILSIFKEGARFPQLVISFWAISGIFSKKERDFRRF